jgi:hypothetical protein
VILRRRKSGEERGEGERERASAGFWARGGRFLLPPPLSFPPLSFFFVDGPGLCFFPLCPGPIWRSRMKMNEEERPTRGRGDEQERRGARPSSRRPPRPFAAAATPPKPDRHTRSLSAAKADRSPRTNDPHNELKRGGPPSSPSARSCPRARTDRPPKNRHPSRFCLSPKSTHTHTQPSFLLAPFKYQ